MERRNTKQRQIVLDAVRSRCDHPSAEQIYEQVHASDPRISLGTVYRNLGVLASEGEILDIKLAEADRFDLTTRPHSHFLCEKCGSLTDIDMPDSDGHDGETVGGYEIHSHQTLYRGICPGCLSK